MKNVHVVVAKNTKNAVEEILKFYCLYSNYNYLFTYKIKNYIYINKEKYTIIPKST